MRKIHKNRLNKNFFNKKSIYYFSYDVELFQEFMRDENNGAKNIFFNITKRFYGINNVVSIDLISKRWKYRNKSINLHEIFTTMAMNFITSLTLCRPK